ncbi:ribonucleotide-diphosphate reductase subunit beta, partial [Herbaspirillum sp. HC18]
MRIEYHRTLLADRVRNAAFHAALSKVIRKGESTVADIGTGTGFLGFLAAKLGAARVDMYDDG